MCIIIIGNFCHDKIDFRFFIKGGDGSFSLIKLRITVIFIPSAYLISHESNVEERKESE